MSDHCLTTLKEYQGILTNTTVSNDSDFDFIMVLYRKFLITILKCLKEIMKCVSKTTMQKNILYYGDPTF